MDVRGQTAIISGASSGLGAALAHELALAGAHVILLARTAVALAEVAAAIQADGGSASWHALDLTDAAALSAWASEQQAAGVAPALIINNAGAGRFLALEETPPADVATMMAAPYFAAAWLTQAWLPLLLHQRHGMIVNITSPAAVLPWAGATAYAAARAAMLGFTNALRADLRGTGVRVLLAMPARIDSAYFANNPGSAERIPRASRIIPTLTPATAAQAIVAGIRANRRSVITPWQLQALLVLERVCPWPLRVLMARTGWQRG